MVPSREEYAKEHGICELDEKVSDYVVKVMSMELININI